jgi:uncharacterized protein (DUF952 family)
VLIYKILLPTQWAEFEATGRFDGSPFDRSSGFIHCSSREQAGDTAMRVFEQEPALVVVALDTDTLGESVRWEQAPHGGLYPMCMRLCRCAPLSRYTGLPERRR